MARKGMLFAAGVITGEALMGIVIAIPIVVAGRADVLALPAGFRIGESAAGEWLGLAVLALLAYWLYRTATSAEAAGSRTQRRASLTLGLALQPPQALGGGVERRVLLGETEPHEPRGRRMLVEHRDRDRGHAVLDR